MRCVEGGKSKAVVLNGEEGLECEVRVYGIRLEHVSEFKYLECIFNESGTDGAECSRKVAGGRRIAGEIMSLVNAKNLQLECARVLHETLLMPLLMYGSETMLWKEKERFRISPVQIDNLRGLLGIRRIDRIPNSRIKELCLVNNCLDERIDEGLLRGIGHVERMERDMITKSVYVEECAGSRSVGRLRKR